MDYTKLNIWIKARALVKGIYTSTNDFPKKNRYNLTDRIRRCAVSIPSNIAEGYGRRTSKDKIRFFYILRGSLYKLETQLYIALDLNYIEESKFNALLKEIMICKKLLGGFINYQKTLKNKS